MLTEATTTSPKSAEAESTADESRYTWVAPAFISVPYEAVRWLVTRAWQHRIMLSPTYATLLLKALAAQGWPTWSLLFGGIACLAVLYVVGRIRETRFGWSAFLMGTTAAGTAWLTAASQLGVLNPWALGSWAMLAGGATLARWKVAEHYKPQPQALAELPSAAKLELLPAPPRHPLQDTIDDICTRLVQLREKIGLSELEIIGHEIVTDNRFTVMVRTRCPTRSVAGERGDIAAKLELPVGMLRQVTGVPNNSGVQVFHFQLGQVHGGEPIEWTPPRWADEDIFDPKKVGVHEDEEDALMVLAEPDIGVHHGAVSGKTGYGKTIHQQVLGSAVANCRNAVVLLGDLKPTLDFAPLAPVVPWYGTTPEEVTKMLVALARLCEPGPFSRGPLKRREDLVLMPTEDSVAIYMFLDEMRMVFSREMNPLYKVANAAAVTIALLGRALGIALHVSGQNMSEPAMPQTGDRSGTEFRAQLHHRRVFHEDKAESGQFLLDDYATLDVTQLKQRGRYFHAAGDTPSLPILGHFMRDRMKLHEWALRRAEGMQGIDERTARLLGEDFATAHQRVPAEVAPWLPSSRPRRVRPVVHAVPELRRRAQEAVKAMVPPSPEVQIAQDLEELEAKLAELDAQTANEAEDVQETADDSPALGQELEQLALGLETGTRKETGASRADLEKASGMRRSFVGARLTALAEEGVVYSTGQAKATRWFVSKDVSGARLRRAIHAVDRTLRMIQVGDSDVE